MKKIQFVKSVVSIKDLPKDKLPEVILCGRSNVGKSSFINTIFNRKGLAKTSSSPGKTRSLNYYLVEDKFYMVDLPGFGYAKVSKKEREKWLNLIDNYLRESESISYAFHFVDSRVGPTDLDILLNDYLNELEIPYLVLLNKIDKLKQSEIAKSKKNIFEIFPELSYGDNLLAFSSTKGIGKKQVVKILSSLFD